MASRPPGLLERLPALAEAAERSDGGEAGAAGAAAAASDDDEGEETYVLLDFGGPDLPPGLELRGEVTLEGLDTARPSVSIGGHRFSGIIEEDVGSTLVFDRASLKRIAESHEQALRDLVYEEESGEQPLVCVTTKRMRLQPAVLGPYPSLAGYPSSSGGVVDGAFEMAATATSTTATAHDGVAGESGRDEPAAAATAGGSATAGAGDASTGTSAGV